MNILFIKAVTIFFLVTVALPILFVYFKYKLIQKTREAAVKQRKREQEMLEEEIQKIYYKEREEYYKMAVKLFNLLMKNRKMTRKDIIHLKKMLNSSLGEYVHEYDYLTYKNDAHEIYDKMKSIHIDKYDWQEIIEFLTLIQKREAA